MPRNARRPVQKQTEQIPRATKTGGSIGIPAGSEVSRPPRDFYQCLYCTGRPTFKKPVDYVMHLLRECFVIRDNEVERASLHQVIKYVVRLLIKERKTYITCEPIGGKSLKLCLLRKATLMLPVSKAFKCVCCSKTDDAVKMAIEHFFPSHFSNQSGDGDGMPMLVTIERLLLKVEKLDAELEACLNLKEILLHGLHTPSSDDVQRAKFREEARMRPKLEYFKCLICNFKATTVSDILNKHGWGCEGKFFKKRIINSCWYQPCGLCDKKILRTDSQIVKHLIDKPHGKLRGNNRNPSKIECEKLQRALNLQ